MYGFIWKVRYALYLVRVMGWWLRPKDIKFSWECAAIGGENIDFEYREYTPKECVHEEISCWYD